MTVKERAHQLVDQFPDHITWDDLLERLAQAARGYSAHSGPAVADSSSRERELRQFLEREIWPQIPATVLGKRVTKEDREAILGYGPAGV
ncbi:MAG: hypothetical protein GY719_06650 [bacterium]|nr:hypothetical protein [bacterium]